MAKQSAGILVYRWGNSGVEVLLAHPGGPFWSKKDTWSVPKGEAEDGEDLMNTALREFKEELGFGPPQTGKYYDLGQSKQSTSKTNYVWAIEGDADLSKFVCNSTFTMEWPPKSGKLQTFAENDRAGWFSLANAKQKLFKGQKVFIDRLAQHLNIQLETEVVPPQQPTLF